MYQPAPFRQHDPETLHAFVREHPFGLLITVGPEGAVADPLPFILDEGSDGTVTLRGHLARTNPQAQALLREGPRRALVSFQGPHAYVSPGWYATKRQTGKAVPTWNYMMVQAEGTAHPVEDQEWLNRLLQDLTERHEAAQAEPWSMNDAPSDFIDAMLRGIVGVEIRAASLIGKWKLSQNKSADDRRGVIDGLTAAGHEDASAIAALMARDLAEE